MADQESKNFADNAKEMRVVRKPLGREKVHKNLAKTSLADFELCRFCSQVSLPYYDVLVEKSLP